MTTRERELIVGALRIRRDLVALMMRNEAPCYKTRDELQALWQELKTLADRIESGQGENETRRIQLDTMARVIQSWIDWDVKARAEGNLTTDDATHIMSLPVPVWPNHGQMKAWVATLNEVVKSL